MFLLSLNKITHLLKIFEKSLKSNFEEELCFSLVFLIFRYSQALQASSQTQEEKYECSRQIISGEICREKFDNQSQHYSPEVFSWEMSQKRKTSIKRKRKSKVGHDDTVTIIHFWSQHEVLLNVKHPNNLDKNCRINTLNRIAEALKEHGMDFRAEKISSKMHSIRVYFSAQRNKLISAKRSRAGT